MENYKKKYENALERAKHYLPELELGDTAMCVFEEIFPELKEKESEDERIRKAILELVKQSSHILNPMNQKSMIAWLEKQGHDGKKWIYEDVYIKEKEQVFQDGVTEVLENLQRYGLEKQGEQNPTDKVESKFKVGDFIVSDYCMGKIIELTNDAYLLDSGQGIPFSCEHNAHLWTIQDAKDGDVLVCSTQCHGEKIEQVGIYKEYIGRYGGCPNSFRIYAGIDWDQHLLIDSTMGSSEIYPATTEQHDLLFQKIHEAGYEWDVKKKELRKIKQNHIWSEEDEKFLNLSLVNLTELKDRFGETYGKVGNCIDWLKFLKEKMKGE